MPFKEKNNNSSSNNNNNTSDSDSNSDNSNNPRQPASEISSLTADAPWTRLSHGSVRTALAPCSYVAQDRWSIRRFFVIVVQHEIFVLDAY